LKDLDAKIFKIYEKPKLNGLLCGTDLLSQTKPQQSDIEEEYQDPGESRLHSLRMLIETANVQELVFYVLP